MKHNEEPNRAESAESLLIDYVWGQGDPATRQQIEQRLGSDPSFKQLHDDLARTHRAVNLTPQVEPPDDLVAKTIARIRQARQVDALITRQELSRTGATPTFSLRELIGVAAAVIILAMLFVPSIQQARRVATQAQCAAYAGQIGTGILSYANDNNECLPMASGGSSRWLPGDKEPVVSNSGALFQLVRRRYAPPQIFVCPGTSQRAGDSAVANGTHDFASAGNITYSYQHAVGAPMRGNDLNLAAVSDKMAILSDATPLFENGRFQPDRMAKANSKNHNGDGQNVLYLNGHVDWRTQAQVGVQGNNIFLAEGIYKYQGNERPVSATDTFLLPSFSGN